MYQWHIHKMPKQFINEYTKEFIWREERRFYMSDRLRDLEISAASGREMEIGNYIGQTYCQFYVFELINMRQMTPVQMIYVMV